MVVAPALAAPPADPLANSLGSFAWEPEVQMGETWGIKFNVLNTTGGGAPNHFCDLSIYEWRDNISYAFATYDIRPECGIQWQGAGNYTSLSPDCYYQSLWDGEFYFIIPITREKGYHAAAPNALTNGSYGTYRWEVHCGNKAGLIKEGNFTVLPEGEPTFLMDWTQFIINYKVYVVYALLAIAVLAIIVYYIKGLIWG